jgi:hypothetical protein
MPLLSWAILAMLAGVLCSPNETVAYICVEVTVLKSYALDILRKTFVPLVPEAGCEPSTLTPEAGATMYCALAATAAELFAAKAIWFI